MSYHNFNGILVDEAEKESIVHDLGDTNKVSTFVVSANFSITTAISRKFCLGWGCRGATEMFAICFFFSGLKMIEGTHLMVISGGRALA